MREFGKISQCRPCHRRQYGACALHTWGCKHTLRICNTYCLPTATVVARTCLSVTLYIHCMSCLLLIIKPVLVLRIRTSPSVPFGSIVLSCVHVLGNQGVKTDRSIIIIIIIIIIKSYPHSQLVAFFLPRFTLRKGQRWTQFVNWRATKCAENMRMLARRILIVIEKSTNWRPSVFPCHFRC